MENTDVYTDFFNEALYMTNCNFLLYDLDIKPWELSTIIDHLKLDGTNWSKKDFAYDGYKNFDEDGDSYEVGVLKIYHKGHTKKDFQVLSSLWTEAEKESLGYGFSSIIT